MALVVSKVEQVAAHTIRLVGWPKHLSLSLCLCLSFAQLAHKGHSTVKAAGVTLRATAYMLLEHTGHVHFCIAPVRYGLASSAA